MDHIPVLRFLGVGRNPNTTRIHTYIPRGHVFKFVGEFFFASDFSCVGRNPNTTRIHTYIPRGHVFKFVGEFFLHRILVVYAAI